MKKFLLIALVAAGFAFAGVSRADAGVHVGIGIGIPIGYGHYGYGYPYYPAYYSPYPYGYYRPGFVRVVHRPYYRSHGRRIYYGRRCR
jgi:hypothetical protein